jgi:hydrogenase maturation factor
VSNERQDPAGASLIEILSGDQITLKHELIPISDTSCVLDSEGHCVTCSDEALPARVLRVDQETGLALVMVQDATEEIDITLVEGVVPGDVLLVHGGVAIGHVPTNDDEGE